MKYFIVNGYRPSPHPPLINGSGYSEVQFGNVKDETKEFRKKRYQMAGLDVPKLGEKVFLRLKGIAEKPDD